MDKSAFEQITTLAPKLSNKQITDLISLLKLMQKGTGLVEKELAAEHAGQSSLDDLFYKQAQKIINKVNGAKYPELLVLKKASPELFHQVLYVREKLDEYLKEWYKKKITRSVRIKFYVLYCKTITEYVNNGTFQVLSMKIMMRYINDFPAILNNHFPGYVQSGLFYLLLGIQKRK